MSGTCFHKKQVDTLPDAPQMFYLGQHHQAIAPCVVYEFDFDQKAHKTYQPSFTID